jgi:hypothetical protein
MFRLFWTLPESMRIFDFDFVVTGKEQKVKKGTIDPIACHKGPNWE